MVGVVGVVDVVGVVGVVGVVVLVVAPTGGLCTACRNQQQQPTNNRQIRNIVRFFSRISGVPVMVRRL